MEKPTTPLPPGVVPSNSRENMASLGGDQEEDGEGRKAIIKEVQDLQVHVNLVSRAYLAREKYGWPARLPIRAVSRASDRLEGCENPVHKNAF